MVSFTCAEDNKRLLNYHILIFKKKKKKEKPTHQSTPTIQRNILQFATVTLHRHSLSS